MDRHPCLGYDLSDVAHLMRLFLIAAIPLVLSVPAQMSIGMNKIKVIALAALVGSLVNLPISCYLTMRLGVSGVIWGTVLTTLFSNLLVPGIYLFRVLEIVPGTYLKRTLGAPLAGMAALLLATATAHFLVPIPDPGKGAGPRVLYLLVHLMAGTAAYIGGYLLVPIGRGDVGELLGKVRRR